MTNKKFKLAAMSLALTACVAASPLAANAESADTEVSNSASTTATSTDETKQESTGETKQESTGETKQESTNESKQESTNETKQDSTNESKQESTDESKQESTDETKQESTNESKQESTNETKQESTDETKQESTDETKQESTDETKQESTDESKQESTDESKQESTNESKQESTDETKQESTDETKQESTDETKQESTNESKQESTDESKQDAADKNEQDAADKNEQDAAVENKVLAEAPAAKAPVLMTAALAPAPAAPTTPMEEDTVATITGQDGTTTQYKSFDEAVSKANNGDTIKVVKDTETAGMELKKDLTIQGVTKTTTKTKDDGTVEETTVKPKLTFKKQGIALWGTDLTFKDMHVEMKDVGSTPYTAEYGWAHSSICSSGNSTLTLDKTDMVMDGTNAGSGIYAIYFTGNDVLDVKNSSTLTINDYSMNALTWDGGDGGYNCNITGGSTFTSDHNRSGFTGTFYVTVDDSDVKVINSRGNGSNGSHYNIKNGSNVNFSGNGSHGLSAGNLTVQNSTVTAENNGLTGIIFTGKGEISDHSTVTITGTKGKSYWNAGLRLMKSNASLTIKDSTVTIKDNAVTGIFCDSNSQLTIEDTANVTVTNNNAAQENCSKKKDLAKKGGGLVVREGASAKLGANTTINNNSAALEGADIFIEAGGKLTFSAGNAGIGDILKDCGDGIDGWYIDAEGQRWDFHGDPSVAQKLLDSKDVALEYNGDGTYTITAGREGLALKAAHAELPAPTPDPNPNPKPEPKPGPDTPVTPEDPQLPPVQDARADTPDSPVLPSSPTNPAVQDAHALPQTGTSLFAALAMALSGFALTIAGAWASLLGKNSRH